MQGNGVMRQNGEQSGGRSVGLPFDSSKLDRYLDEAGIDVLIATSKHNVRYLLGGHLHHFFAAMITHWRTLRSPTMYCLIVFVL